MPDSRYLNDPFGRSQLVIDFDKMPRAERIRELNNLAGRLRADPNLGVQWLGEQFQAWLRNGGDFAAVLAIKPSRGSRLTAPAIVRAEMVHDRLVRLAREVGTAARASRVLRGLEPCPPGAQDVVDELRHLKAPRSRRAIVRAKAATRRA